MSKGVKMDSGKPMMSLIPPHAEKVVAEVLTFGAEKYAPDNWRKVPDAERRYLDAAMRHLNAYRSGDQLDDESGLHHLAHAACCMLFLLELSISPHPSFKNKRTVASGATLKDSEGYY